MNKYLLLRDNKQTGPYTVEELVQKGIKPYDLVWLEGRSAAWRYPSEMPDLKDFAPVVEEQPYDRFYKRSSSTQEHAIHAAQQNDQPLPAVDHISEIPFTATQTDQQSAIAAKTSTAVTVQETPVANPIPKTGTGKVYVTLPAGFSPRATTQVTATKPVQTETSVQPIAQAQAQVPVPVQASAQPATQPESAAVSDEAVKALEARAEALARSVQQAATAAAAKKQSAQQAIQEQKTKQADAGNVKKPAAKPATQPVQFSQLINTDHQPETAPVIPIRFSGKQHRMLMRGIVAVCLLLGGIVIGMAITYSRSASSNQDALDQLVQKLQERELQRQAVGNQAQTAEESTTPVSTANYAEENTPPPDDDQSSKPLPPSRQLAMREKAHMAPPETNEAAISYQEKEPYTMKVSPAVVTRKEEPRPVSQAEVNVAREKIFQMVQVAASPFQTGVLGGISNLYFTISNTSSFPLDQIELEIKYLGPEKRVVKVQRLIFNDIDANGQKTLEAPRTTRGVSIDYVVTKINSRALGIAHAGF